MNEELSEDFEKFVEYNLLKYSLIETIFEIMRECTRYSHFRQDFFK